MGVSMIEVLIAMGMIAIVFLFLFMNQINLNQQTEETYFQTIAFSQLENFSEMLLANQKEKIRQKLFTQWNAHNTYFLPQGQGSFVNHDDHSCRITVQWFFKTAQQVSVRVFC